MPLESRRRERALAVQKLNHAVPAVGLLMVGGQALLAGVHGLELALAVIEVVASALVVATIGHSARQARAHGRAGLHHGHGVDWVDIAVAALLFVEAFEKWHAKHHIARPTILLGFITLALGLFHGRLMARTAGRRSLHVSDGGISVGGPPFRALRAGWHDIASITVTPAHGEIRTRAGRIRRLNLADLGTGAPPVIAALAAARDHLEQLRAAEAAAAAAESLKLKG